MPSDEELISEWATSSGPVSDKDLLAEWAGGQISEPSSFSELEGIKNNLMQGIASTVGFLADVNPTGTNFARYLVNPDQPFFQSGAILEQGFKDVGLQSEVEPQTPGGRILGHGAEYLPMGPLAAVSGLVGGVAREAGAGPYVQLASELLTGGIVPAGKALLSKGRQAISAATRPFTASGQKLSAAQTLQEAGLNPSSLKGITQALVPDDFSAYRSTAELTQSPGLARLERSLAQASPEMGEQYSQRLIDRAALRSSKFSDLVPGQALPAEEAGLALRDALTKGYGGIREGVSDAFMAARKGESNIAVTSAQRAVKRKLKELSGVGSGWEKGVGGPVGELLQDVLSSKAYRPIEYLQNIRSRALEIARNSGNPNSPTASKKAASLASTIASTMDDALDKAVASKKGLYPLQREAFKEIKDLRKSLAGDEGFAPSQLEQVRAVRKELDTVIASEPKLTDRQVEALRAARSLRREQALTYEQGSIASILGKKGTQVVDSKVVSRIFNGTPESIRQFKKAAPGAIPTLKKGVLEQFRKSITDKNGELTQGRFSQALKTKSEALKELLSKEEYSNLEKIYQDLASENSVRDLATRAARGESTTFQNLSTGAFISRVKQSLGGKVSLRHPFLTSMLKTPLEIIARVNKEKVDQILFEAVLDPAFARDLISKATPQTVERVTKRLASELLATEAKIGVGFAGSDKEP